MRNPNRSRAIEQALSPFMQFRNVNMLAGTENLPEFFTRKRRACLVEGKAIRKNMVHCLKKKVLSLFELRKCLSALAFRKYIAVRVSRPTCRPQLRRNKSSRVGDSNRRVYLTTVKTRIQEHMD